MNTTKLAKEAMINYLQSEGIYISNSEAAAAIEKWDSRNPGLDFLSLAAIAISDSSENALSENEIRQIRNFYFPSKDFLEGGFI